MRLRLISMFLVLFAVTPFSSEIVARDIPNGIYKLVREGAGTKVTRSSGGTIEIGERVSANFGTPKMWSLSNENDRFRVQLSAAGPFDITGRHVLYVDGVCDVISSYTDPNKDGQIEVIADFGGNMTAQRVAAGLKTTLIEREHPGHQLLVSWKPLKESYKLGDPVTLELRMVNVGETTIRFMEGGQQRGARDNQFGFTAFSGSGYGKAVPDTGDPVNFGGIGAFRELKPNDIFRKEIDITKWFKFEKPDSYQITGMYELELQTEDFGAYVLWDEFATGRCLVRIVK